MNSIAFRLVSDSERAGPGLGISIDGRDLIDLVRAHERLFAQREGHEAIAGAYAYLPASLVRPPSKHFWGAANKLNSYGLRRVALADCPCGCSGCWPLVCEIVEDDHLVIWRAFEQPHRRTHSAGGWWDYSDFGPFSFGREQYQHALNAVAG